MKVNPSIPRKRILVVDDEPLVRDSVRMVLAFDGYEVQTASGGTEALELLEHESFDLVITDFNMPGIKGDELAVKIKARWPRKPVIMLTVIRSLEWMLCSANLLISRYSAL
jgi:CheY-like chemotaxis protein